MRREWSALLAVVALAPAVAPATAGAALRSDPVPLPGCQPLDGAGMSFGNGRAWPQAGASTPVICDDGPDLGNGFRRDTIRFYDADNVWVDTIVTPFEAVFSAVATASGVYVAANATPTDQAQTGIVRRFVKTGGVWSLDPDWQLRNGDGTPSAVRGRAIAASFPDRIWVADAAFARRLSDGSGGAFGNDEIHVFGGDGRRLAQVATTVWDDVAPRTAGALGQGSVTDIDVDFYGNLLVATESRGTNVRVHLFADPDPEVGHDPVPTGTLGAAGAVDCASVGGPIGASYGVRITDTVPAEIHVLDTTCGAVRRYSTAGAALGTTPIGTFPPPGEKPHGFATNANGSYFLPQGMQRIGWPTDVALSNPAVLGGGLGGGGGDTVAWNGAACTLLGDAALADDLVVATGTVACGRGGDDVLRPSTEGSTVLDGGAGTDVVSLAAAPFPVVLNLFNQDAFSDAPGAGGFYSQFGSAALRTVEGVVGGPFDDVVTGSDGADRITGGTGADTINARAGDDVVDVRDGGVDTVSCGGGEDTVTADAAGVDSLTGCETVAFATGTPGGGGTTPDPGPTPGGGGTTPGTTAPPTPSTPPTDLAGRAPLTSALRAAAPPLRGLRTSRARAVLPVRLLEPGRVTVTLRAPVRGRTVTVATGTARRTTPGTARVTVRRTRAGRAYWARRGTLRPTVRIDVTRPGRAPLRAQRAVRLR